MPFHFWKLPVPNLVSYVAFNSGSNIELVCQHSVLPNPAPLPLELWSGGFALPESVSSRDVIQDSGSNIPSA
ncbi:hypothetical protein PGTUg99_015443 [Puccinia graminis f. sp. tritici]|uniref:Uncharacterized protein n=1 Tax=Puccinia graminis f. sp. tritici TaxID=56615 RepID=A0A5B0QZ92_PUCGR|nr:hypothetical protein PGTUg99_015443 [Puccinia graminis f. sp. tritici]